MTSDLLVPGNGGELEFSIKDCNFVESGDSLALVTSLSFSHNPRFKGLHVPVDACVREQMLSHHFGKHLTFNDKTYQTTVGLLFFSSMVAVVRI